MSQDLRKDETGGLHSTVEGFMQGLKNLPKGSPSRGKFITQHMNHGPFLDALSQHPQGKQIHSMLTQHLNSKANAGFKPGATVVTAKSEEVGTEMSKNEKTVVDVLREIGKVVKQVADNQKLQKSEFTAQEVAIKVGQVIKEEIESLKAKLVDLDKKEKLNKHSGTNKGTGVVKRHSMGPGISSMGQDVRNAKYFKDKKMPILESDSKAEARIKAKQSLKDQLATPKPNLPKSEEKLDKVTPPDVSEKTMYKLKDEYGHDKAGKAKAFATAWKIHDEKVKKHAADGDSGKVESEEKLTKDELHPDLKMGPTKEGVNNGTKNRTKYNHVEAPHGSYQIANHGFGNIHLNYTPKGGSLSDFKPIGKFKNKGETYKALNTHHTSMINKSAEDLNKGWNPSSGSNPPTTATSGSMSMGEKNLEKDVGGLPSDATPNLNDQLKKKSVFDLIKKPKNKTVFDHLNKNLGNIDKPKKQDSAGSGGENKPVKKLKDIKKSPLNKKTESIEKKSFLGGKDQVSQHMAYDASKQASKDAKNMKMPGNQQYTKPKMPSPSQHMDRFNQFQDFMPKVNKGEEDIRAKNDAIKDFKQYKADEPKEHAEHIKQQNQSHKLDRGPLGRIQALKNSGSKLKAMKKDVEDFDKKLKQS